MINLRWRRRVAPWEVVDLKIVDPVPMFYDDDDIDIIRLSDCETRGTYVFDFQTGPKREWRKALLFARQQLLQEIAKRDFNVLLLEGWQLTVMRRGKVHRIEVQYNGRGALASRKLPPRPPPFMDLLSNE